MPIQARVQIRFKAQFIMAVPQNMTPRCNKNNQGTKNKSPKKINISSHRNYINSINTSNVTYVKLTDQSGLGVTTMARFATLNVKSIKNKDHLIVNELNDNNVDIVLITETWLKDTEEDQAWLAQSEFKQGNFNTPVKNRPGNKKGGGIVIIYRKPYKIIQLKEGHKPTIEFAIWKIVIKTKPINILGLYHSPQCSKSNYKWHVPGQPHRPSHRKIPKLSNKIIMGTSTSVWRMYPMLIQLSSMIQCRHWA